MPGQNYQKIVVSIEIFYLIFKSILSTQIIEIDKKLLIKLWIQQQTIIRCDWLYINITNYTTTMITYNNLVEATNDLMKRGYTENLSLEGDTVDDKDKHIQMTADDFEIDEFYRFEGMTNPADMSIVYAVTSDKYNLKGVLVNAYGTYANNSSSAIEAKLHHNQVSDNLHSADRPVGD